MDVKETIESSTLLSESVESLVGLIKANGPGIAREAIQFAMFIGVAEGRRKEAASGRADVVERLNDQMRSYVGW